MKKEYVIGLDFGTDSVRSVLVDTSNGNQIGTHVHEYTRWKSGKFCDPIKNQFRQHALDHLEGMEITIQQVVKTSGVPAADIKGICIDTTGSSPLPVDRNGTALCLLPGLEDNPNAMMVLWKDHTAIKEAEEINHLSRSWGGVDYTQFEGGIYSSEWFWAKILHITRTDITIKKNAWSWMEHCDWLTFILTGSTSLETFKRSRCAAGHKAMWHASWGGLPSEKFLSSLDPYLSEVKRNLYHETFTSDLPAGKLCPEWAKKVGLITDTTIAVGTFDAHAGAVGAEIKEFTLVRVMGTSTCDILVSAPNTMGTKTVEGICGQVDGSVIPGMIGLEAGQSAFGDLLAWYRDLLSWPWDNFIARSELLTKDLKEKLAREWNEKMIDELSHHAEKLPISNGAPIALDWVNGRRTPNANQSLKAAIMNISLGTSAPQVFRSLVEAICFGSKKIVERFQEEGVIIKEVVGIGGVAKKSPFVMQTLADVLNLPIKVAVSDQAPALGAAMYAAVAADIHATLQDAIQAMGNGFEKTYTPNKTNARKYEELYSQYNLLGTFIEAKTNHHK